MLSGWEPQRLGCTELVAHKATGRWRGVARALTASAMELNDPGAAVNTRSPAHAPRS